MKLDIDDEVATVFLEVTGVRLYTDRNLSRISCDLCVRSIQHFSAMKLQLINNQIEQQQTRQSYIVKIEPDDDEISDSESTIMDFKIPFEDKECEQCHQKFPTNFALKWHRKKKHPINSLETNIFRCPYKNCRVILHSVTSLRDHKRLMHSNRQSKEEITRNEPKDRQVKQEVVQGYYCEVCDQQIQRKNNFRKHLNSIKHKSKYDRSRINRAFKCRRCDKSYVDNSSLRRHMEDYHNFPRFKCNLGSCRHNFFELEDVFEHLNKMHNNISQSGKNAIIEVFQKKFGDEESNNSTGDDIEEGVEDVLISEDQDSNDQKSDDFLYDEITDESDYFI